MKVSLYKIIGPGFVIAATGLGAGDLITATIAGAQFHTSLLWAVMLGAILKGVLNEGLARWQLVTGYTLLEGWVRYLPQWLKYYFVAYLFLWAFLVSAALMAACGLAAHNLVSALSINQWAIIHSLVAAMLVTVGRYSLFESLMKLFIGIMFITVLVATFSLELSWEEVLSGFVPTVPTNSLKLILGVIGGVGGSVTLLCYGYWMQEKQWQGPSDIKAMRIDLCFAYGVTALFGICIVLLAAKSQPESLKGTAILVALAMQLELLLGEFYAKLFLIGFWGVVFSSMLGVWQGVPYLYNDFVMMLKEVKRDSTNLKRYSLGKIKTKSYYLFLVYLAVPPYIMLYFEKPVWLVIAYAVAGAFFMPLLAATLLYLNNKSQWLAQYCNTWKSNTPLVGALLLFLILLYQKIVF